MRNGFAGGAMNAMDNWNNTNNQIRAGAAGMATGAQIGQSIGSLRQALGRYQPANQYYLNTMQNGMYSPQERARMEATASQSVINQGRAAQSALGARMASRGLGGGLAGLAVGNEARFAAGAARGDALNQIAQDQAMSRMSAAQGYSGNAGAMAGINSDMARYQSMPTQESALNMIQQGGAAQFQPYMDLYDQWRNAQRGPNGATRQMQQPLSPYDQPILVGYNRGGY